MDITIKAEGDLHIDTITRLKIAVGRWARHLPKHW